MAAKKTPKKVTTNNRVVKALDNPPISQDDLRASLESQRLQIQESRRTEDRRPVLPEDPTHAACRAIETELRRQITDLKDDIETLRTDNRELLDRFMLVVDPRGGSAIMNARVGADAALPAPPRPVVPNTREHRAQVRRPFLVGNPQPASAARAAGLTPESEGFGNAERAAIDARKEELRTHRSQTPTAADEAGVLDTAAPSGTPK